MWWSSKQLALVPQLHTLRSMRNTRLRRRAPGCSTLCIPRAAASHPGGYQAEKQAFLTDPRCIFCEGRDLACASGEEPQLLPPLPAG